MFNLLDQSLTWRDVEMLAEISDLPVVVKGVLTPEDARMALDHGAGAIVVSNHGGRQLDGVPATLDALPDVVEAVDGRVEVYVDGGVRRGTDVATAVALGARAVLIGRPVVWALTAGGEDGVRRLLGLLRDEIELALALLGCPSPDALGPEHVAAPNRHR
jgi:isopentenyl diphosphate isomerase/L-lactate dehydrogenase-like FMN-dependent dehydrogenase